MLHQYVKNVTVHYQLIRKEAALRRTTVRLTDEAERAVEQLKHRAEGFNLSRFISESIITFHRKQKPL